MRVNGYGIIWRGKWGMEEILSLGGVVVGGFIAERQIPSALSSVCKSRCKGV